MPLVLRKLSVCIIIFVVSLTILAQQKQQESICFGQVHKGTIQFSQRLPYEGKNFKAYSFLGYTIGRTYAHSKVIQSIEHAYQALATVLPESYFIYGEMGWKTGGSFKPHKTHQNGLSIDFIVPIKNIKNQKSLNCAAVNKYCYGIEFDAKGKYKNYEIDFYAINEHLYQLYLATKKNNMDIKKVIFDPQLQVFLKKQSNWKKITNKITFSKNRVWVRHDDHYHIDFDVKCE